MMRNLVAVMLLVCLILVLFGCGGSDDTPTPDEGGPAKAYGALRKTWQAPRPGGEAPPYYALLH
jgi:hypothetical protein